MRPTPFSLLLVPVLWSVPAARALEVPVAPPVEATPGDSSRGDPGRGEPAPGSPAPGSPMPIQVFPMARVVPKGEARAIAFFAYLYPDCASQGPVVARILEPPRRGTVTFAPTESFPRYAPGSPLAPCNARKVPGLRMTYETEEGVEGLDTTRILTINPDGTAAEYAVKVWIR